MRRLMTVIKERQMLRDKYRMFLEDEYIKEKKLEELKEKYPQIVDREQLMLQDEYE